MKHIVCLLFQNDIFGSLNDGLLSRAAAAEAALAVDMKQHHHANPTSSSSGPSSAAITSSNNSQLNSNSLENNNNNNNNGSSTPISSPTNPFPQIKTDMMYVAPVNSLINSRVHQVQ